MRAAYRVADVRAAEAALMAQLPEGALMQRAAAGLARTCIAVLEGRRGGVTGAAVVVLVGSGNNGGDALWAGARLAGRGAAVHALLLSSTPHAEGLAALLAAGGRTVDIGVEGPPRVAADLVRGADLVLDGIVGIGGAGPLRPAAASLARAALAGGGARVAVDLPSGIDPDTGAVADADAAFVADVTVTFGTAKPGLLLMPAADHVGVLEVVDIGLGPCLPAEPDLRVLDRAEVALLVAPPTADDHKYSRGVVGVAAGSRQFPGAALLCTGGARRGGAGMVALLGRDPAAALAVVSRFPDVVTAGAIADEPRAGAWVVGPGLGLGLGAAEITIVCDALATPGPVLLDADGLRLLAESDQVADTLRARVEAGRVTVITPHDGEFARLGFTAGVGAEADRAGAARRAAAALGVVVLLKGATTVVAEPGGRTWVNLLATPALATAGSGDVLAGLTGSLLAHAAASAAAGGEPGMLDLAEAARVVAAGAWLHGLAGRLAEQGSRPVTALDLVDALPDAVARTRSALA